MQQQSQQYFDASTGAAPQQMGYPLPEAGISQSMMMTQVHSTHGGTPAFMAHNSTSVSVMSSLSGAAPSLTFTPSGSTGSTVPAFRNVKKNVKGLGEAYENAVVAGFNADAAFIQNIVTAIEKEQRAKDNAAAGTTTTERDEKPLPEPEIKPDAEAYAFIQQRATLDAFRQTASQATWTARHLPNTANSHVDQDFELPQNLDNPTLNEVRITAGDQVRVMQRFRKSFADCIAGMSEAVKEPTKEEVADFLKSEFLQYNY